jgi:ABC-2 type transport system ATP-binding protein
MPNNIAVAGLNKTYKRIVALSHISFSLGRGECVGLLGPNGAGKTSLLSCLAGLRVPSAGAVRILGQDPTRLTQPGRTLAYVFDPPGLTSDFTAGGCLRWEALAQGLPPSSAADAVERYGIEPFANRRVGRLSAGQRQRVAIAAGLIGDPEVLLLDEPTNGLDVEASRWLREVVVDRTRRGRTTIVSSHQLNEVRRVVDRVVVINSTMRYDGVLPSVADDALESWYFAAINQEGLGAR